MAAIILYMTGPTEDRAHGGVEECGKGVGSKEGCFAVAFILAYLVAFEQGIDGDKAEVVVIDGLGNYWLEGIGVSFCCLLYGLTLVIGKVHP